MAIIVNKEEKRKNIALSCKELIIEGSIKDITIEKIAKKAKIAKGSFYDYFKNKEDLVFEIITILIDEYNKKLQLKLNDTNDIKEKLNIFAEFFYIDEDKKLRKIYKEFIAISLTNQDEDMKKFQTKCFNIYKEWLTKILKESIDKNELKKEAIFLSDSILSTFNGFYIRNEISFTQKSLQNMIKEYIEFIYSLVKVDK